MSRWFNKIAILNYLTNIGDDYFNGGSFDDEKLLFSDYIFK